MSSEMNGEASSLHMLQLSKGPAVCLGDPGTERKPVHESRRRQGAGGLRDWSGQNLVLVCVLENHRKASSSR